MNNRGLHRYAVLVAISTLLLIFIGGLVTSTGSGLSVPDWPLSFGRFFPKVSGGAAYEHGHRMAAALVGCLTIVLAIWMLTRETRRWARALAIASVGAIVLQALLGGATVLFRLPPVLSVAHAALAEIFLCINAAIALATSRRWQSEHYPTSYNDVSRSRNLAAAATIVVFLQVILGAMMRHAGGGLAIPDFPLSYGRIIPPFFTWPIAFNFSHRLVGFVALVIIALLVKALRHSHFDQSVRRTSILLLCALIAQISLGAATIWFRKAPTITTIHVACGAFTLAVCLLLAMDLFRAKDPAPELRGMEATAA